MPGKGMLTLTGLLGESMRESAQAAVSYLRSHSKELELDTSKFHKTDLHIHVPAGAVPKDGPSAGVAIAAALISLFRGKPIQNGPGHDRRGHAHRARFAGWRRPREDPRRAPGRHQERAHPPAQRKRPGRDPGGSQGRPDLATGRHARRCRTPPVPQGVAQVQPASPRPSRNPPLKSDRPSNPVWEPDPTRRPPSSTPNHPVGQGRLDLVISHWSLVIGEPVLQIDGPRWNS